VTVTWTTQYYLTVVSDHGTPAGEGWYDDGSNAVSFVTSPAEETSDTRWRCTGFTGTGSAPASGTGASTGTFVLDEPSTVTWGWVQQWHVDVTVTPGGAGTVSSDPFAADWFFDDGAGIDLTPESGEGYVFNEWSGDLTGSTVPDSLTVDSAKSVTAGFLAIPQAGFSAAETTGTSPFSVDFTNESSGDIDTYSWDFGDGTPVSTETEPTHEYTIPGWYTVTLTATGSAGSDSSTRHSYILVAGNIWYVDGSVSGSGTGMSWAEAFKMIQEGIDAAAPGEVVLVADGAYSGFGNTNLSFTGKDIILRSVGGYGNCAIECDSAFRGMVFTTGETNAAVVSGFDIVDGHTSGGRGGGIYCTSSPTIRDCRFTNCVAVYDGGGGSGGGVQCYGGSQHIEDCVFHGCSASAGGGIEVNLNSTAVVSRCLFEACSASEGGGFRVLSSNPVLTDSILVGCTAQYGGAISVVGGQPSIRNCRVTGNTAATTGGAAFIKWCPSPPVFVNCTIYGNHVTGGSGGGFYCDDGACTLRNTILWGNTSTGSGYQMFADINSPITLTNTNFCTDAFHMNLAVPATMSACVYSDPELVDPASGDYSLQGSSPCIDAGSNALVPGGVTEDIMGNPRIVDGDGDTTSTVDIGAYEFQ
ncbi:MAG: PKD domain-containing protein, partial [Planctomycetes bacterium]|nr:PKD domain-containing protein [Planctomycetota bacterium]